MDTLRMHPYQDQSNITRSRASRKTADGRRLTYTLHVLQQPEKARACGNGAKASADRRPVDPPPVVELRVFEGEDDDNLTDITTTYHNVNFFLFATLEQRPVATGRVVNPNPGPPTVAVLNGCNVAGINYLERPEPAGYFIFPDLSVRHEGHYRLTFGLYEQVKDARDADPSNPFPPQDGRKAESGSEPLNHNCSVQRLEVRSEEFQVFSAKKFPGLDRSTGLSIGLSDQGCRVRIRRDVRMRKRPKPKPLNDGAHGPDLRGRYTPTDGMALPHDRSRSMSHCSRDGSQYGERRLSLHAGDVYGHAQQAPMGHSTPVPGAGFAVPATPTALPPLASYHQPHLASPALPSPVSAGPSRLQEYVHPALRPYEHRASDASSYCASEAASRRPSELTNYHRSSDAYRTMEPVSYRPQEPLYRSHEPAPYRPSEPARYVPVDGNGYRPMESRAQPAHYTYGPDGTQTITPEKPILPGVQELINGRGIPDAEQVQPGKRNYSPPRWSSESLKRGMRPNLTHDDNEPPFPGLLEYKRANGTTSQATGSRRF